MFNRLTALALASALTAFGPMASAQQAPQQTAAGAQKFLSLLASEAHLYVSILEKNGSTASVQGTRTTTFRWLKGGVPQANGPYPDATEPVTATMKWMLVLTKIAAVDRAANPDDCTTRLDTAVDTKDKFGGTETSDSFIKQETFFGFDRLDYRKTITTQYEDPAVKYAGPHFITWGRAVITRNSSGRVFATLQDARFDIQLVYIGDVRKDAEMSDRVEFAMKFLKASCDKTAATGF